MLETHRVSATALVSRLLAARSGQVVPGGGKHILIACMPKSASTYLCGAISQLPEMKEAVLTVGHHRREQELCPVECALVHKFNYVASHHVRYSKATSDIMRLFGIFPVILVRNIYDCVVSLRDHLLRESLDIPQAYVPRNFRALTTERQFDYIVDFIIPWYASFFASWNEYDGPAIRLSYERLVQDFPTEIERILNAIGFAASRGHIQSALEQVNPGERRFNVGRVGRGLEMLSGHQIERIRKQFSFYASIPALDTVLGDNPASISNFNGKQRFA
jgi:hypothetical protein